MNIILEDGSAILNVKRIEKRSDIKDGAKLYYELGHKLNSNHSPVNNWVSSGKFKEIREPEKFRDADNRLDDTEYIKHHNFVVSVNGS